MLIKGSIVEGKIESIAFGGTGIVRYGGQVVFVANTVQGEEISARVYETKKNFARAQLIKINKSSPYRQIAECKYFSVCGGCQLQHIDYKEQLRVKRRFVLDALIRVGRFDKPQVELIQASSQFFSYRRHIRLHFNKSHIGYMAADGQEIINIDTCAIFDQENLRLFLALRGLIGELKSPGQLSLFKGNSSSYVVLFELKRMPTQKIMNDALKNVPELNGIVWRTPHEFKNTGDCQLEFEIDGLKINYSPHAFVQGHAEQSANLYRQLSEQMKKFKPERVLDLYCGIGATSLLIARDGVRVFGVESNPEAIRLARHNATTNSIGNLEWAMADVDTVIDKILLSFRPDAIVLNPPRTGLSGKVLSALLAYKPKIIFYISCMPATLARDLAKLSQNGYALEYCQPYDMFPQTTHVESLVILHHDCC